MNLNYYPLFISLEIHHFPSECLNWTDKEINIKYIRNTDTTSQTALMVGLTGMLFFVDIYISNITMTCCYSVALSFYLLPLCRKGRSSELHTFKRKWDLSEKRDVFQNNRKTQLHDLKLTGKSICLSQSPYTHAIWDAPGFIHERLGLMNYFSYFFMAPGAPGNENWSVTCECQNI